MVCLGLEPGAAGWKAQTNPLSYGGTPQMTFSFIPFQFGHYQSKMGFDENENQLKLDLSIVHSTMSRATETAQVSIYINVHITN